MSLSAVGNGQTVEGDILRGQGAYLRGAGWYNLRTAKANSVNVDATIRWKQDLRKIQQERSYLEAQKAADKKQNVEEFRRQMAQRDQELRTNPSANDVQSGAALNALVYDLTDPELNFNKWKSVSPISLPPGASVKELIFTFTPHRVSTQASAALSRGVIALSRLDIKDEWPVLLKKDELSKERKAYEDAYIRVRDKVLRGDYAVDEILALDTALDGLKRKVAIEIPSERGFRTEATKFADDLREATRMFDANSVEYAREILIDTKDHDAATVEELVAFMTKYRLQFANSERSPTARVLYGQIYDKLRQQMTALDIKPGVPELSSIPPVPPGGKWVPLFNGKNLSGWQVESGDPKRWAVEGGAIVARGEGAFTFLVTDVDYSNFILRLEYSSDEGVRSGVGLRAIVGEHMKAANGKKTPNVTHPLIFLGDSSGKAATGTMAFLLDATRAVAPEKSPEPLKARTWHRVEIEMRGRSIRVAANDKPVVSVSGDPSAKLADGTPTGLNRTKGRIGLQSSVGGAGTVRFRNIEVMELSPSK
jgi:hypothetical protein